MTNGILTSAFAFLISMLVATAASANTPDVSLWENEVQSNPDGVSFRNGDATLSRFPVSSLDQASGGGMRGLVNSEARERIEMALSIVEFGMSNFEMTTLHGMPAAIGTAETYDGEVSFAAAFSGRKGSEDELFSVFFAPDDTFQAMGGLLVLKENAPRANAVYASNPPQTKDRQSPKSKSVNAKPKVSDDKPKISSGAAALLAGVKGDLDRASQKNAEKRKLESQAQAKRDAEALAAERARLYAKSGARKGRYPAPTEKMEYFAWPQLGAWQVQVPNDQSSPRMFQKTISGINLEPSRALDQVVNETGLDIRGKTKFETLESYQSLDGRDFRILLVETRMPSDTGVAFVLYGRLKGSDTASIFVMETPLSTYKSWGSVAGMLRMRGIIPSVDVVPKQERKRLSNASLRQQMAFYEAVLDKFYVTQSIALMRTQAQTTAMMMELNYDLLFGDDISSPFIAD